MHIDHTGKIFGHRFFAPRESDSRFAMFRRYEMLRECDYFGRFEKAPRKIATVRDRNGQLLENSRFAVFRIFGMLLECGDVGRCE